MTLQLWNCSLVTLRDCSRPKRMGKMFYSICLTFVTKKSFKKVIKKPDWNKCVVHLGWSQKHFLLCVAAGCRVRVIGSSTLALCHLASGAADAYYQFGLHCWDLAAATVIIREAGGTVIDTSGEQNALAFPLTVGGLGECHPCGSTSFLAISCRRVCTLH